MYKIKSKRLSILFPARKALYSRSLGNFEHNAQSKHFEFDKAEKFIYKWWDDAGNFKPSTNLTKTPFVIPMPPPNVTGSLHIGHALGLAIQDVIARFERMRGKAVVWIPGTDHAGIATQLQIEKLLRSEGTSRAEVGREEFLRRTFQWKDEKGGYIVEQMKRLGASADWSREQFTLSPSLSYSVVEAFVRLHEKGLVYRGQYMVNWSPNLQTAVSDLEVEFSEEAGKMYYFKYELADGSGFIPVATTRPETILGDSAVCVHPDDDRYKRFIGKTLRVPFMNREIKVLGDAYVDPEFGTGALKVTPSHDPNDYAIGKRHDLQFINIFNKDATINGAGGAYAGLDRYVCRAKIWRDLQLAGQAIEEKVHSMRVPRSQRGGEPIEFMVSDQWFVRTEKMAQQALELSRSKALRIEPARFEPVWEDWLTNIKDWCVSRQLWWGHRIPVYYVENSPSEFIVARSPAEAASIALQKYGKVVTLKQEEDVLDTWFSSGLWPFAINGWPTTPDVSTDHGVADSMNDYARFYPASTLVTGYDILFFWVARMVMLGQELTGFSPFQTIYLHGLVRDEHGHKMSKTRGNVIDPIEAVDKYGADALRFALVMGTTSPGQDVPLSLERIESGRNFANKLWNMGKLVTLRLGDGGPLSPSALISKQEFLTLPVPEQFILTRCRETVRAVTIALNANLFAEAGNLIQVFAWDDLADWYLELIKVGHRNSSTSISVRVLATVWMDLLKLLHPFMPFITEALWQQMFHFSRNSIMVSNWPVVEKEDGDTSLSAEQSLALFPDLQNIIRNIRNIRSEYKTPAGKKIPAVIQISDSSDKSIVEFISSERAVISFLCNLSEDDLSVAVVQADVVHKCQLQTYAGIQCAHAVVKEGVHVFIPVADMVDKKQELSRLRKVAESLRQEISGLSRRLDSKGFRDKATEEVISSTTDMHREKSEKLLAVERSITSLLSS